MDGKPSSFLFEQLPMYTILTQRLALRPLREDDLVALAAAVNNDRIARNLLRVPWPYDLNHARAFHLYTKNLPARSAVFAIALADDSATVIGIVGYEPSGIDWELGYWLSEEHWGKGYMGEAAQAAVGHAFTISAHERLMSCCFIDNAASRHVLLRLGFRPAGTGSVLAPVRQQQVVTQKFELSAKEWRHLREQSGRSKTAA
jgi:RimJ/RimL family protein N-acetyltransferase